MRVRVRVHGGDDGCGCCLPLTGNNNLWFSVSAYLFWIIEVVVVADVVVVWFYSESINSFLIANVLPPPPQPLSTQRCWHTLALFRLANNKSVCEKSVNHPARFTTICIQLCLCCVVCMFSFLVPSLFCIIHYVTFAHEYRTCCFCFLMPIFAPYLMYSLNTKTVLLQSNGKKKEKKPYLNSYS